METIIPEFKRPFIPVEGNYYTFVLHAEIVLPDGEKQYLLTDPSGTKHLLSYNNYKHYGFEKGQELMIRIDKISCSGKIYLEPAHPYYTEGEWYYFSFLRSEERENIFGETELVWIVEDIHHNEVAIPMKVDVHEPGRGEAIQCRLTRIRKGFIYLSHPQSKTAEGQLLVGNWIDFLVEKDVAVIDDIPYYILVDFDGHRHLLKKKPFEAYGIEIGQQVSCKVVKWSNKGIYILEPKHPLYREDQEYSFEVKDVGIDTISVVDVFGNTIEIQVDVKQPYVTGNRILLKVLEIRKGVPVLQWP